MGGARLGIESFVAPEMNVKIVDSGCDSAVISHITEKWYFCTDVRKSLSIRKLPSFWPMILQDNISKLSACPNRFRYKIYKFHLCLFVPQDLGQMLSTKDRMKLTQCFSNCQIGI